DIMHALFENIAPHMFRHFIGKFFKNETLNNTEYKILKKNWNKIEKIIEYNKKAMPTDFGRPLINIQKYYLSFKAEEYLNGWTNFVKATKLCLNQTLSKDELEEIRILFIKFIKHYEQEYYQKKSERLQAAFISFHYLLYIAESIYETGPAWATWQFLIERLCEMLIPLVNSHVHPYKNLINKLTIWTCFVHLQYNDKYHQQIFKPIFNESFNKEKLFSLSKEHIMAKGEIQKIKQYYATEFDLLLKNIIINTTKIYKYSKLKTKSGSIIGSLFSNNDEDIKRNNYSIAVTKFLVNKNAHCPKAPIVFEEQEFYGRVLYYFTYEYVNEIHLLAYIHW
ncbi:6954_t:CDS:2, partial [Gigaspora margarita]